jgi:hypothetical protein
MKNRHSTILDIIRYCGLDLSEEIVFVEVGVWEAELSEILLSKVHFLKYYAVDPWKHLESWNKPFNVSPEKFEEVFAIAENRLKKFSNVEIIRGKSEDICTIGMQPNMIYIDGDHTLSGILTDLLVWYDRLAKGGFIIFDDYIELDSEFQHSSEYDKTMVKPIVDIFCKAKGLQGVEAENSQFILRKPL